MANTINAQATVKELKVEAKDLGIKGYSKMKKTELVSAIEAFIAKVEPDEDYYDMELECSYEEYIDRLDQKISEGDKLTKRLAIAWICQSVHSYTKDGRVLFFTSNKHKDVKISMNKRLIKVTSDLLDQLYGVVEQDKWMLRINRACKAMVDRGYCHDYIGKDGKHSIHMDVDEWNKCAEVYKANKKAAKQYVAFINTK